jgi:hypothetical protein
MSGSMKIVPEYGGAADVSSGADVAAINIIAIAKARCLDRISSSPRKSERDDRSDAWTGAESLRRTSAQDWRRRNSGSAASVSSVRHDGSGTTRSELASRRYARVASAMPFVEGTLAYEVYREADGRQA